MGLNSTHGAGHSARIEHSSRVSSKQPGSSTVQNDNTSVFTQANQKKAAQGQTPQKKQNSVASTLAQTIVGDHNVDKINMSKLKSCISNGEYGCVSDLSTQDSVRELLSRFNHQLVTPQSNSMILQILKITDSKTGAGEPVITFFKGKNAALPSANPDSFSVAYTYSDGHNEDATYNMKNYSLKDVTLDDSRTGARATIDANGNCTTYGGYFPKDLKLAPEDMKDANGKVLKGKALVNHIQRLAEVR